MTKHTTRFMRKVRRDLARYAHKEATTCGNEWEVVEAKIAGVKLLAMIQTEVEELAKKAGLE
jgi:hypothetical protein